MKQLKFLETKRTPRYSLRKFSVGVASVLLGVTIFGINLTDHSVKAATPESVETNTQKATSATEKVQQNGASNGVPEKVQQNGASNDVTEKVQQNSGSKNATANNSTESATTLQSSPETQDSEVRMQQLIILQNLRQPHNLYQRRKVALTLILNH